MTGIERDAQAGERLVVVYWRQEFRGPPESGHRFARGVVAGEAQGEDTFGIPVGYDARGLPVDCNQVRWDTVRAINALDKVRKFVVSNGLLIFFQHLPP